MGVGCPRILFCGLSARRYNRLVRRLQSDFHRERLMSDALRSSVSRRDLLAGSASFGALLLTGAAPAAKASPSHASGSDPFGYCLNTSTIRGQKLSLVEEMEVAAKAGYRGLEPWIREIQPYVEGGGSLGDLKKRAVDLGLSIESAIGFADWASDDDAKRAKGLEQWRRDSEWIKAMGGCRMAAPVIAGFRTLIDLRAVVDRYCELLRISRSIGVMPQLEVWGASKSFSRMSQLAYVLIEAAQPDACGLLDAYQIYLAGSDFAGMRFLNGSTMHVFHVNDYPADPPREKIRDSDRVYPGDGVCPLTTVFRNLYEIGFRGMLSLELFNRDYRKHDALTAARTGLEKTRAAVRRAMEHGTC